LEWLKVIHLNDSKKGLGSRVDRHTHIGEGELGIEPFRLLMNDPRLDGLPGVLETPKGDDETEDARNMATLRGLIGAQATPAREAELIVE
jgi:deoxyribonuclease-4